MTTRTYAVCYVTRHYGPHDARSIVSVHSSPAVAVAEASRLDNAMPQPPTYPQDVYETCYEPVEIVNPFHPDKPDPAYCDGEAVFVIPLRVTTP